MKVNEDARILGRYPTAVLYAQGCEVAGVAVPQNSQEAEEFARLCLARVKVKSELLVKAHVLEMTHSMALDRISAMLWFPNWHDLTTFASRFGKLSAEEREGDMRSYRLAAGAWILESNHADVPVVKGMLGYQKAFLDELDLEGVASALIERVMFRGGSVDRSASRKATDHLSADQVKQIFEEYLSWEPADFVMRLLERVPTKGKRRMPMPQLSDLKLGKLLEMPLANAESDEGFGVAGWGHLLVDMVGQLVVWASVFAKGGPLDDQAEVRAETERLKARAESMATRVACKEALLEMLAPLANHSVLEAYSRTEREDGFYRDLYSGCPEEVEVQIGKILHVNVAKGLTRLAFREPHGKYALSVFRRTCRMENPPARSCMHEVEAVLHDEHDRLAARVGICLSLLPENAHIETILWQLDAANESDLLEVAAAVINKGVEDGLDESWTRLLIVRDWEVRKDLRGQGLGVEFLRSAIRIAVKGMPRPRAVAARVWPTQFEVPPFTRGVARHLPEIAGPVDSLRRYWNNAVLDGGVLPKSIEDHVDVEYQPFFHRGLGDFEQVAMGQLMAVARGWQRR